VNRKCFWPRLQSAKTVICTTDLHRPNVCATRKPLLFTIHYLRFATRYVWRGEIRKSRSEAVIEPA